MLLMTLNKAGLAGDGTGLISAICWKSDVIDFGLDLSET